jgi:hypothetical protein
MFSTLRTRFGIPGVISVMALVFAMFGGAYAASNSSGGGKATASAKAKTGPRGKTGKAGPAGPAGPAGLAGPKGDPGAAGSNGINGSPGSPGAVGKSVKSESFEGTNEPAGEPCAEQGGVQFEVEGSGVKKYACNGVAGQNGTTGFTETLPEGKTETGMWAVSLPEYEGEILEGNLAAAASFNIPVATKPQPLFIPPAPIANPDSAHCPGTYENPQAVQGWLCIYANTLSQASLSFITSSRTGFIVHLFVSGVFATQSEGSFAVTG